VAHGDRAGAYRTLQAFRQALEAGGGAAESAPADRGRRRGGRLEDLVVPADARYRRLHEGLAAGLDSEQRRSLASLLGTLAEQYREAARPIYERLAAVPVSGIVARMRQAAAVFGPQSERVVDLSLYLLEQRGYDGTEPGLYNVHWGAIYAQSHYRPARVLPLFAWTQKIGVLSGGDPQFTVESVIYAARLAMKAPELRHQKDLYPAYLALFEEPLAIAGGKNAPAAAAGYYHAIVGLSWTASDTFGRPDRTVADLEVRLAHERDPSVRHDARIRLAMHYLSKAHQPARACEILEDVVTGVDGMDYAPRGLFYLGVCADQTDDPAVRRRFEDAGRLAMSKVEPTSDTYARLKELLDATP
jgi:hypothetical protein